MNDLISSQNCNRWTKIHAFSYHNNIDAILTFHGRDHCYILFDIIPLNTTPCTLRTEFHTTWAMNDLISSQNCNRWTKIHAFSYHSKIESILTFAVEQNFKQFGP
ncbi:hypothetical protein BKA69DRAFT_1171349 [Paraphysoderma sedebokerense]|nr:hypothetical protein BKA69DRAFT_1171349 [Paraphysoderma sedebokerense]